MSFWATVLIIVAIGLGTFCFRLSFLLVQDRFRMPTWFRQALRFVPVTVLPALIAPQLLYRQGIIDLSLDNPRWLAGLVAIVVAAWTRQALLSIGVGLATLWLIQWLI